MKALRDELGPILTSKQPEDAAAKIYTGTKYMLFYGY